MQERHVNRKKYFQEQEFTTQKYVIPFIESFIEISDQLSILEIGCGEGGNLKPFLDIGCKCMGIDLNKQQIENAKLFYENHPYNSKLELISEDIYNMGHLNIQFDIIMLRDVIEHIPNQEKFMHFVKRFLKKNGVLFFGYPPWYNPFGGHQQVLTGIASKIPYYHILPMKLYIGILNMLGHKTEDIKELIEIKETGISIERFERILKNEKYNVIKKQHFLVNPNYFIKFGLKPRNVLFPFQKIPFLRNFYTTAVYYLLEIRD